MNGQTRNMFTNKQVKLKYIKGDTEIDDEFDDLCDNTKARTNDTSLIAENEKYEFQKEIQIDLQSIKERNLTPDNRKTQSLNEKRSASFERNDTDNKAVILEKRQSIFSNKELMIITESSSIIKFDSNFSTKDADLKLLVDLINENVGSWKKVLNDDDVSIFKKSFNSNPTILLKTFATVNGYDKDQILEAIVNVSIRSKWDQIFEEFKELDDETIYCSIKVILYNLVSKYFCAR
jgi:hypothetical protein